MKFLWRCDNGKINRISLNMLDSNPVNYQELQTSDIY